MAPPPERLHHLRHGRRSRGGQNSPGVSPIPHRAPWSVALRRSCVAQPRHGRCISQLFKKAAAYADRTCDRWYILSAKHHLVHPDTVIDP
ncbi:DUF6884 domain-containing protein [Arthrobacter globiformis]|uniref:DUF6884 domain-containing protein n=1 Tax=Arthrobacter globiformis TaxID=1665 RepID=UPI00358F06B1